MSKQTYDPVSNPKHYHRDGVDFECVELSTLFPHPIASAVEYVFRYKAKNGVEDLRKAVWWLQYARKHEELIAFRVDSKLAYERTKQLLVATDDVTEAVFWGHLAVFSIVVKNSRVWLDGMIKALSRLIDDQEETQA